jgi:hypothetical protein
MKKIVVMLAVVILAMLAAGCQNGSGSEFPSYMLATPTMTEYGYEMYSWQEGGEWYFALVEHNFEKRTIDEIKNSEWVVKGLEKFKESLQYMHKGEWIFWTEYVIEGTVLPERSVLYDIVEYCKTLGIDITISI